MGMTGFWPLWRAWWMIVRLGASRMIWSMQSLAAMAMVAGMAVLVLIVRLMFEQRQEMEFHVVFFGQRVLDFIYLRFLLPMLCLCYGTQSLGGDWEEKSLVWLLTRPVPRPWIYLAKYAAALPLTLGLSLGGLFLLGLAGGTAGMTAALAFWPVVVWGCLAYLALFLFLGSWFRRSTVIAVTYTFVIEAILSNMPGLVKRICISFYNRCLLYDIAKERGWDTHRDGYGITPDRIGFFLPVDGTTARWVLAGVTVGLLLLGIWAFSRREYQDLT